MAGEVVIRFRLCNRVQRTISAQVSYGDDPAYQAAHPELQSWSSILAPADFFRAGTWQQSGVLDLGPSDAADIEMRMKPVAAGRAALFISAISRGFNAKWTDSDPYLIEVDPNMSP